jgi:hypothetical protein
MRAVLAGVVALIALAVVAVPIAELLWSAGQSLHQRTSLSDAEDAPGGTRTASTAATSQPLLPEPALLARVPVADAPLVRPAFSLERFVPPQR